MYNKNIILLFFFCACSMKKQEVIKKNVMTLLEFKAKTIEKNIELKKLVQLNDSASIELIKISNTINYYNLNDTPFQTYQVIFLNTYLQKIVTRLGCQISAGMGYYCPKYNISIGGASWFEKGCFFEIDSSTLPKGTLLPNGKKAGG